MFRLGKYSVIRVIIIIICSGLLGVVFLKGIMTKAESHSYVQKCQLRHIWADSYSPFTAILFSFLNT